MAWIDIDTLLAQDPPTQKEADEVQEFAARRAKPRFYADEDFPPRAIAVLRHMGAQVQSALEMGRTRQPDENHAAYARRNHLILVSCDRDFLNDRRFPLIHVPAIFVFNFGGGTEREIAQAFRCLATAFRVPYFCDKWVKVDAQRDCWTAVSRFQNGTMSRARYRMWRGRIQEWVGNEG